ncbi:LIM-domain-containing protein [Neocallimastix lanati (nom. inval.)]|jgi:paxillin|uniref:LIM-domain-containing protein n=1 Tax=Neocallimastix californiae TaxID=1754190 RepID=A0A1Y2CLT6_9FUNG|nr:LIM-domain-containing protein [Neocallimastix sp. JGI-2020a]ORY47960.1 LIM-domain-containing protein [Neocallimastix californiae]|eukprot:ORY47960.1 LIM-domain-containing protein [Neocallimastix californiae]
MANTKDDEYTNMRDRFNKLGLDNSSNTRNTDPFSTASMPSQSNKQDRRQPYGFRNEEEEEQNDDETDPNKKPKRKLELYRMDPILIPGYTGEDNGNKISTPEQEIMNQIKDTDLECHYCQQPIQSSDEKIMIGQNFYHTDHVQCNKCGKPLDPDKILELGDDIYCEVCFESECDLGKNLCGYCNEEIFGDLYIKALDKVWHPNHFFCSYCGCKFDEDTPFFDIDGKPYCEEDYKRLYSRICKGCNEIIEDDFMSAMEMCWHPECFKCHICNKSLCEDPFYCVDCELYCEFHYQEKENLLCEYCKKPVDKRYVMALNKKWHPNHFFCSFCKNVLYTDIGFKEHDNKPYCKDCFIRLYG